MNYERPKLTLLGSFTDLTRDSGNSGNDPCRDIQGNLKQTGASDYLTGQAGGPSNLATCSI